MLEVVTYVFTVSLSTIIPPFVAVPIELAASSKFGLSLAFLYTLSGNILGAVVGFLIARRFGWIIIKKLFHERHVTKAKYFAKKYSFWRMTWTRMLLVSLFDVLSWAAGLTSITIGRFILSTFISNIPITILVLLFGTKVNLNYAMMGWMSVGILVVSVYLVYIALKSKPVKEVVKAEDNI